MSEVILVSPQGRTAAGALAAGSGSGSGVHQRRQESLGGRLAALAGLRALLGAASALVDAPRQQNRGPGYQLSAAAVPPYVQVRVDAISSDDRFVSGLDTQLEIFDNSEGRATGSALGGAAAASTLKQGPILTLPLPQTAPGRYETEVYLPRTGAFMLRAVHRGASTPAGPGPVVAESWGTLSLSLLARVPGAAAGSRSARSHRPSHVWGPLRARRAGAVAREETLRYLRPLWLYLVGAAIAVLLLDVFLRRVRLFGYRRLTL